MNTSISRVLFLVISLTVIPAANAVDDERSERTLSPSEEHAKNPDALKSLASSSQGGSRRGHSRKIVAPDTPEEKARHEAFMKEFKEKYPKVPKKYGRRAYRELLVMDDFSAKHPDVTCTKARKSMRCSSSDGSKIRFRLMTVEAAAKYAGDKTKTKFPEVEAKIAAKAKAEADAAAAAQAGPTFENYVNSNNGEIGSVNRSQSAFEDAAAAGESGGVGFQRGPASNSNSSNGAGSAK